MSVVISQELAKRLYEALAERSVTHPLALEVSAAAAAAEDRWGVLPELTDADIRDIAQSVPFKANDDDLIRFARAVLSARTGRL